MLIAAGLFVSSLLLWTTSGSPNAHAIIQRSVAANQKDWEAEPHYSYTEKQRLDNGAIKTFKNLMIDGSPYERLIAIDGKPLSANQSAEEQDKLNKEIKKRHAESPSERSARIAKYQKERTRDHVMIQQLTKAFSFRLEGEQQLNGRKVYVLTATPRPGYVPLNSEAKALTGMKGTLWLDTRTYQWVRVEAQVVHPVLIDGLLARVEPGTQFELEKGPVQGGIWLPKHFAMKSLAKVFEVYSRRSQEEDTFSDYRKN